MKITESDLAKSCVDYLRNGDWETWHEVPLPNGAVADIVAKKGPVFWNIEVKTSLSFDVIAQIYNNCGYFHLSSVFTFGVGKPGKGRDMAMRILSDYGFGLLTIGKNNLDYDQILEINVPEFRRFAAVSKIELFNDQKTQISGAVSGNHMTAFQRTKNALIKYVRENPGTSLKRAVENIPYHYHKYSTAYSCLSRYIPEVITELKWKNGGLYINE